PPQYAVAAVGDERPGALVVGEPRHLPGQPSGVKALRRALALVVPASPADLGPLTRLLGPTVERIPGLSPCFGHRLQRGTNVAEESHLWPSQTADVLGPDVDLDDLLPWRKERWAAKDQIRVEPRTQDQGDVGRRQSDPSMDQPSQALRGAVVDQPASPAGGGHPNACS